jgi:hypothetical protein
MPDIIHKFAIFILVAVGLILGATGRSHGQADLSKPAISSSTVKGGPAYEHLTLPVPRTIDLTHVEPEHFAAALRKDPQRIFEFVRDHVAYEVYSGCLRGPRGTLLAMAGNSVDRAALLAALLEKAGQRVRFVRGILPEADAKELVSSMWAKRPRPIPKGGGTKKAPALKAAADTLVNGIQRDYNLIRDHLKKSEPLPARQPGPSFEDLVKESQPHYWVQWSQDNNWLDLDPSFADSIPGWTSAKREKLFAALPEEVYHRVTIRIQLEEYGIYLQGNAETKPSHREILRYTAKAADLSGRALVLTHQPDNWQGPAKDLKSALAAAVKDTGKVKPVLLTSADQWTAGQGFRQKVPAGGGLGGLFADLAGEGTRRPMPIATAESIEFEFVYPGGPKETVIRETFDVVGQARRAADKKLSAEQGRKLRQADRAFYPSRAVYDLFFTTGSVQLAHLSNIVTGEVLKGGKPPGLQTAFRRMHIVFAGISNGLLTEFDWRNRSATRFYPDSPRLQIMELNTLSGKSQVSLDLRRNRSRGVVIGQHPEDLFSSQVLRGVAEGTLERVLTDNFLAPVSKKQDWRPVLSTSLLLELAHVQKVPTLVLQGKLSNQIEGLSENTAALLQTQLQGDCVAVTSARPIKLNEQLRLAWWQVNLRSGETIGMTDEGLHGTTTERHIVVINDAGAVQVSSMTFVDGVFAGGQTVVEDLPGGLNEFIAQILASGESITNLTGIPLAPL